MNQADAEELIKHLRGVHADGVTLSDWRNSEDTFVTDVMDLIHAMYEWGFAEAQVQAIEAVGKLNEEDVK